MTIRGLFIIVIGVTMFHRASPQQNETIVVNPVKQNEQEVLKRIFQYAEFTPGTAFYKDGEIVNSKLNYNYFTNQIMFIDPKGDTLQLINGGNFSKIVISTDTFYYHNKDFIQQISHYTSYNLLIKRSLENIGSEKKGAYGAYSSNSAISNINTIVDNRSGTVNLLSDQNITFAFKDSYFVSGKFQQYYPANKKGISDLFGKNEKQLKEFLEKNNINFSKKEDLEKLIEYAHTVLK